jgi:hypothetical protein
MPFRFRRSVKLAPGVRVNVTRRGVSSVTVGSRRAGINVRKGRTTGRVRLMTGLSYSRKLSNHGCGLWLLTLALTAAGGALLHLV